MKVYLGGSIHGGREFAEGLKLICGVLEEMGHEVLTRDFVVNLSEVDFGPQRDDFGIVRRDLARVEEGEVLIAEVSKGSHGVGYEHRHAEGLGKPILLLRHASLAQELTKSSFLFATGFPRLRFSYYDESSIKGLLEEFFKEFYPEGRIVRERE